MGLPYERELLSLMRNMLGVTVALCHRWGLGKDFTSEAQPQVRLRLTTAPFHTNNNHALQIVAGVSHAEWVTRTHNELRCNVQKRMSQWVGAGHWLCLLAHGIKPGELCRWLVALSHAIRSRYRPRWSASALSSLRSFLIAIGVSSSEVIP